MDLKIGTASGPPATQFGRIAALAMDDQGAIYVGDRHSYDVRKFSREGEFLLRFGRRGSGPGEFAAINGLAILGDGRLAVVDRMQRRVSLFDRETGRYIGEWKSPDQWLTWSRHTIVPRAAGGAYLGLAPQMALDGTPVKWPRPVFVSVDNRGSVVDTIAAPARYVEECGTRSSHAVRSGYYEDLRVRYAPKVVWSINPIGDLLIGCPNKLQFDIIPREGEMVASEVVRTEPVPIVGEEIAWFLSNIESNRGFAEDLARTNGVEVNPVNELLSYSYPETKAAYKTITVGEDGTVWVRLSPHGSIMTGPGGIRYWGNGRGGVFEVFDGSGRHIGRTILPADVKIDPDRPPTVPAVIGQEHLLAVTVDSLDIEYVSRYVIRWPRRGR
jgi:hypothetical protein